MGNVVGKSAFADLGYDGDGVIVANVEAFHAWASHQTLNQSIQHQIQLPGLAATANLHATQVSSVIVAAGTYDDDSSTITGAGMAPGATLWTGRLSTTSGFTITENSVLWAYMVAGDVGINDSGVIGGAGAKTADVFNSSWGFTDDPGDTGNTFIHVIVDYLANANNKVVVISAGNSGPGSETVLGPANAWNTIAVGASVGSNNTVWSSSSRGPTGSFDEAQTRIKPDILAPGTSFAFLPTMASPTAFQDGSQSGTSFASPTVAGGAALMIDAGRATGRSTDARLVKAILLNSATKLSGWTQTVETHPTDGTRINSTPLDVNQGAGRMNLNDALTQYMASGGSGSGAGVVNGIGWDVNTVSQFATRDYIFSGVLEAGTQLTATLIWFMDRTVDGFDHTSGDPGAGTSYFNDSFDDIDLFLYEVDAGGTPIGDAVAASISGWDSGTPDDPGAGWDSVEHLSLTVDDPGRYMLRVEWRQELFDFVDDANVEDFALAWSLDPVPLPEPASLLLLAIGLVAVVFLRKRLLHESDE